MTLLETYRMNPDEKSVDIEAIKDRMIKFGFHPVVCEKTYRHLRVEGRGGNRYNPGPVKVVFQYDEGNEISGELNFSTEVDLKIQEEMMNEFRKPI